jgi:1-acyl-sn-glycerol-3-phosphate acyltransferase
MTTEIAPAASSQTAPAVSGATDRSARVRGGVGVARPRDGAGDAAWSPACYAIGRAIGRFVFFLTVRSYEIRPEVPERAGPYVLALTHLGNLDPFVSGVLIERPMRWMTRREFFRYRPAAWLLRKVGCFSVNRQGIPVSSVRHAIAIARSGQVVAICPEGGRTWGRAAAFRGGPFKRGVCSIALRAGVPVVPCVMLGTPDLNRVKPWLPFKNARIWVAYGEPIHPPPGEASTRATRDALRDRISAAYVRLYQEMLERFGLRDEDVP